MHASVTGNPVQDILIPLAVYSILQNDGRHPDLPSTWWSLHFDRLDQRSVARRWQKSAADEELSTAGWDTTTTITLRFAHSPPLRGYPF